MLYRVGTFATQRKNRILGFPGIIALATTTTTITTANSILPRNAFATAKRQTTKLTSLLREYKGTKVGEPYEGGGSTKFWGSTKPK